MSEEQSESPPAGSEEETWNLLIFPQLEDGSNFEEVRDKLASTLKVNKEKVETWYDAESPTVLLKGVAKNVAERYMEAIMQCGAACNIQPANESGGLSLIPKSRNVDFFICPSCEHEEEIARGTKLEQCPECGLIMERWEQKMKEEAEKERVRRKMMREQRHADDDAADLERKREELERLRARQVELMNELGIKAPGRFWRLLEKHPLPVAGALGIVLLVAAAFVFIEVDKYLEAQELAALRAAPVPDPVAEVAPVVTAAVQLKQNGNQAVVAEMATVTATMHGTVAAPQQEISRSAQQMMKGVDAQNFVATASKSSVPGGMTLSGPEGQEPVRINLDTIGGISGLQGIERFEPGVLADIAPALLEHGHEDVLQVLSEEVRVPDPLDPEVMMTVEKIEDMDGSMIVTLMKDLARDQEWDRFLASNVRVFIDEGSMEEASELIDRIKNPVTKIQSLGDYMIRMLLDDPDATLKLPMARVANELQDIADPDSKAKVLLSLGLRLSQAGYGEEPAGSIRRVNEMIGAAPTPYEKSYLSSRLAIAHLENGNLAQARALLNAAVSQAGQVSDTTRRVSAFTRIAQRYYDARNATLANEILNEAQVLAATRLEPTDRSRVFGEIAIAQGYMGDLEGALMSIDNAGVGVARQQLMAKLAEFLIGLERYYDAQSVMEAMTDPLEFNRLEIRLITALHYADEREEVRLRLEQAMSSANRIDDPAQRGIVLSQYGRLASRAGFDDHADIFFEAAANVAERLDGRALAVSRGLLGLEQARALMRYSAQETMFGVDEAIVNDPISTEIVATERVVDSLMPASVRTQVEPEPEY